MAAEEAEEIDAGVLESLAAKIDGLDLTAREAAVLETVLARAASADAEVEGFGVAFEVETTLKATGDVNLTGPATSWGRAIGMPLSATVNRYIGETEKNLGR